MSVQPTSHLADISSQSNDNVEALQSMDITGEEGSHRRTLWEGSSQYRHWRYSEEQLLEHRTQLNRGAVSAIKHAFDAEEPGSSDGIEFLTATDEHALVTLYVGKITQLCQHFRFDEEVEATAMTYLKRFYLKNTVMDWHPKNVMLTALFLAAKTTNHPIALEAYTAHIPKTSPNDVLDLEFLLAQSLSFEFAVWHAHRAMWGIWLDLQTLPDSRPEAIKDIYNAALDHVRASRLTDAEFIYAPAQIALASLYLASEPHAEQWAKAKGVTMGDSSSDGPTGFGVIKKAAQMIAQGSAEINVEVVREVDRRLRLCKNPEKIPGTKAYQRRQAAAEAASAEKKARKMATESQSMDMEEDVFGEKVMIDAQRTAISSPDDD